jgi:hypothetical protein
MCAASNDAVQKQTASNSGDVDAEMERVEGRLTLVTQKVPKGHFLRLLRRYMGHKASQSRKAGEGGGNTAWNDVPMIATAEGELRRVQQTRHLQAQWIGLFQKEVVGGG